MSASTFLSRPDAETGKKIYADYHGVRTTRELDATFNIWKYNSLTTGTKNGPKSLAYNPDLILDGRHDIAAAHYPLVDMQSQWDEDYLEYEILSAKAAGIDGFWIEWGYIDHISNTLLTRMQPIAEKYGFEIGVNICDAWLFNQASVNRTQSQVVTREDKLLYFKECIQYLINEVLTGPTAPRVQGRPVVYLFGGGITPQELAWIEAQEYDLPEGTSFPVILRRVSPPGSLVSGNYVAGSPLAAAAPWAGTKIIPAAWIPERLRPGTPTSAFPTYDYYALGSDAVAYLEGFNREIWSDASLPLRSGLVTPGMDNTGCGGWSDTEARFYMISRNNGDTYRNMWRYNVENVEKLDMVYIASWSDYTEGHEIEPTVQNSDRELYTTLEYAAQFKGIITDNSGIPLPRTLLNQRKRLKFLNSFGTETQTRQLDQAAHAIAEGVYTTAADILAEVEIVLTAEESQIVSTSFSVPTEDLRFVGSYTQPETGVYELDGTRFGVGLPTEAREKVAEGYFDAYLCLEYYDMGRTDINIAQKRKDELPTTFNVAAQIRQDNKQVWRPVKIRLYARNLLLNGTEWLSQQADLSFYGRTRVRNVSFDFITYDRESNE